MTKKQFAKHLLDLWEEFKEQHYFENGNFVYGMDDWMRWLTEKYKLNDAE